MAERINPVKETFSPLSKAQWEYDQARNEIAQDLPVVAEVTDKLDALVRLRVAMLESRLQRDQPERAMAIKVGTIAAGVAVLFPPFYFQGASGARLGLGHSFILSPPPISKDSPLVGSIDGLGLLAILAGVAFVTWVATLVKWRR